MEEKFDNLHHRLDELKDDVKPLKNLPCGIHNEKIKALAGRVNWLYFVFVVVVIGGIVLGLWVKG